MELRTLLQSERGGFKAGEQKVALDYSHLDPTAMENTKQAKDEREKELQLLEAKIKKQEQEAQIKAKQILDEANEESLEIINSARTEAVRLKEQVQTEYDELMSKAKEDLEREKAQLEKEKDLQYKEIEVFKEQVRMETEEEVWSTLKDEAARKAEVQFERLIAQVHTILNEVITRRKEILGEAEKEIADLVILIARKVVKVLSEKDGKVVIQNVVQALEKLRGREKFIIHVNTSDLDNLQEYIPKIKKELEIDGKISLVEDTKVDVGGCIIETEFGDIDARVSTQLAEIERRIRDTELVRNVSF